MMRFGWKRGPLAAAALAACVAAFGGECGSLSGLHDLATEASQVTGRTTAGAAVALVEDRGSVVGRALAGADGAFTVRAASPGRLSVVTNDLAGRGAWREVVALGGLTVDVGALESRPLESFPRLFELRGIGFEERLSHDDGDHQDARFTSDASRVYTLRSLPHADTVELVETRTGDGSARVVRSGETIAGFYSFGEDALPALFADRYYAMLFRRSSTGTLRDTWVVTDVGGGPDVEVPTDSATRYDGVGALQSPYVSRGPFFVGGERPRVVYGVTVARPSVELQQREIVELCAIALAEGAASRRCVRVPPAPTRIEWQGAAAQVVASGVAWRVDLAAESPVLEQVDALGYSVDDGLWRERGTLLGLRGAGVGLLAMGDASGADLREVARVGGDRWFHRISADGALRYALAGVGTNVGNDLTHVADLQAGGLVALPTELAVGVDTLPVRYWCEYESRYRSARAAGEDEVGRCFDDEAGPGVVLARLTANAEQCARAGAGRDADCRAGYGLAVRYDVATQTASVRSASAVVRAPVGTLRAAVVSDDATGHQQLALGEGGDLRQATFLTADHRDVAWSPDASALLYYARDPVRGYVGLFRLDVATLRSLWQGHTN